MSDEIHIIPAEGQSAEEVAEVFTQAAQARGMDAAAIHVEGDEVVLPQEVAASLRTNVQSFPPVNQLYQLEAPVALFKPGTNTDQMAQLEGFDVIVNQSSIPF